MILDLDARLQAKRRAEREAANLAAGSEPADDARDPGACDMAKKRAAKKTTSAAKGDRWAMLNTMVDLAIRDLTAAEIKVWLVLFRDVRSGLARTSMADIARRAGLEPRSAKRAMRSLEARRLVKIVAHGTIDGKPNTYQLKMPT